MKYDEFMELVKAEDQYSPSPRSRSLFPALSFFWQILFEVIGSGLKTQFLGYKREYMPLGSFRILNRCTRIGSRVKVKGIDNIRKLEGPAVVVCNHMSSLDTVILPCFLFQKMPVTFVLKASLMKYPIFKRFLKGMNAVTVTRKSPKEDLKAAIKGGAEAIKNGTGIIVFPQSTRTLNFDPKKFNSLALRIAREAGCQVLPVTLKTDVWSNGKIIKDLGKIDPNKDVRITFGEPYYVENLKTDQQRLVDFLGNNLKSWGMYNPGASEPAGKED